MATQTLRETKKKQQKSSLSFDSILMSILMGITGKKLEREIKKKTTETILLEEKHENFIAAVRK